MHAVCVLVNNGLLRDALDAGVQVKLHAVFLIRLHQKIADLRSVAPAILGIISTTMTFVPMEAK